MNADQLHGSWNILKGKVKRKWGELTDDEVRRIDGNWDQLIGMIQLHYGLDRATAEREVRDWH